MSVGNLTKNMMYVFTHIHVSFHQTLRRQKRVEIPEGSRHWNNTKVDQIHYMTQYII